MFALCLLKFPTNTLECLRLGRFSEREAVFLSLSPFCGCSSLCHRTAMRFWRTSLVTSSSIVQLFFLYLDYLVFQGISRPILEFSSIVADLLA